MTERQLLDLYVRLSDHERVDLFLQLIHSLTVLARDTYEPQLSSVKFELRDINEIQHRLSRRAHYALNKNSPFSDADTAEYLFGIFNDLGASKLLEQALKPIY